MKTENMVFVFGSNLGGIHGSGAAAYARNYKGAQLGVGVGRTGQCYALPTKGLADVGTGQMRVGETLSLHVIELFVDEFIKYAEQHPNMCFQVTRIGCGLAGLKDEKVAPLFNNAPYNCFFDTAWRPYLTRDESHFWGTF